MIKSIVSENFNNILEFGRAVDSRPLNPYFANYTDFSNASNLEKSFNGVNTYQEAQNLLYNGYDQAVEPLASSYEQTILNLKNKKIVSVVGYTPIVPNAIKGLPCSMINTQKTPQPIKTMTLYYSPVSNKDTSTQDLLDAGKKFMQLVATLDHQGIKLKIVMVPYAAMSRCNKPKNSYYGALTTVSIKDYNQPINFKKISYCLAHPAFFRVQGFHWVETFPKIQKLYKNLGFSPFESSLELKEEFKSELKKNRIIAPDAYFFTFPDLKNSKVDDIIKFLDCFKI